MTDLPAIGGGRGDEALINHPLQGRRTRTSINGDQCLLCSHCLKFYQRISDGVHGMILGWRPSGQHGRSSESTSKNNAVATQSLILTHSTTKCKFTEWRGTSAEY